MMNLAARAHSVTGTCGPLLIRVEAADDRLASFACAYLELFSRPWSAITRSVDVEIVRSFDGSAAAGSYLECGQMRVDAEGNAFVASTRHGITARGSIGESADRWTLHVPGDLVLDEPQIGNLEDLFSLICTAGWRAEGWIAVHAGAVVGPSCCALLCAPSGGGKSTLTVALLTAGWTTLGDDKVLLRAGGERPQLRPLLNTLNLHPQTRRWLPLAGIEELPRYSAWTEKRRVGVETLTSAPLPDAAAATHLICIDRTRVAGGVRVTRMSGEELLPALLRQIVIPRDASVARMALQAAASCVRGMKGGVRLEIGEGAYGDASWLSSLEPALA